MSKALHNGWSYGACTELETCLAERIVQDFPSIELVRFVKTFPEVIIDKPPITMWKLIRKWGMPPRRNARYCCQELKERGGLGLVITGIRAAESVRRADRKIMEPCFRNKHKFYLNPILDWSTSAVWEYIRERGLRYCCLYDEGWKRVGCVLCPMSRDIERDMARWPRVCAAWERAVKATFKDKGTWHTPDEYWRWWLDRRASSPKPDPDPVLFEDNPEMADDQ